MKRKIKMLAVTGLVAGVLCALTVSAAAAGEAGIYDLEIKDTKYTVNVQSKDMKNSGDKLTATEVQVDGVAKQLYQDGEKFHISYGEADPAKFQLILTLSGAPADPVVPTASNIYYIDQGQAEGGNVDFTVYPKQMSKEEYHIYRSYTGGTALEEIASFRYLQPFVLGDADQDGSVDVRDAIHMKKGFVGSVTPALDPVICNVDGIDGVDIADVIALLRSFVA